MMNKRRLLKGLLILNLPIIVTIGLITIIITNAIGFSIVYTIVLPISGLIVVNLFLFFILEKLLKSVNSIKMFLQNLSEGNLDFKEKLKSNLLFNVNEIDTKLFSIIDELGNTVNVIKEISSGNLTTDADQIKSNTIVGNELLQLQERLQKDNAELEKSKKDEEERNWAAIGLAEFGDLLRQDSHNIQVMGYNIISKLVDYIEANQGALYVLNEEEDEEPYHEIVASVAYNRKKLLNTKIGIGEGLVGQCAFERKTLYMTDIPDDYINITSGLGTANPSTLLIIPCMIEETVLGIIEIASFNTIEPYQIEFIEKLGESIASSISTVRNNEKTKALLDASQNQSEELAAQEEELRQNLEEMETTQEDLRRQMSLNEKMQEELTFEKYLFDTLLNNIPARINFKDRDRKYIRASKSFLERFGKQSNDEIIGKTDVDFFGEEFASKTMADELEIMETGKGRVNFIEHEEKENAQDIWKNVSKIPLYDDNNECLGIFASVYDITDYKLVELENEKLKEELKKLKAKK